MKFEQVLELVKAMSESSLTEFKYEESGVKLSLKREKEQIAVPMAGTMTVGGQMMSVPQVSQDMSGIPAMQPGVSSTVGMTSEAANNSENETADIQMAGEVVASPLVGTFYAASSEDADAFVKVGDTVKKGQVLAIVEAMKLMNEIESEYDGTVVEILAENGAGVEYGQPLFRIA